MKDKDIIELATKFREGFLEGQNPHNYCFALTLPLSCYLDQIDIKNQMVTFDIDAINYNGDDLTKNIEVIEHYCILIDNKILDCTASQFKGMPDVYFGNAPVWYTNMKVKF